MDDATQAVATHLEAPVLVTGAAGFIGRHLVATLLERGVATRALLLRGEETPASWHEPIENGLLEIHRGDVTEPTSLVAPCDGVGTVVHLAAVVTDWGPEALFRRVTVGGTDNIMRAAAAGAPSGTPARCVLASSIVVYGSHLRHRPCPEDTPFGPTVGVYSRAKQAQELLARELAPKLGVELAVVRPANVYGLGSRPWQQMVAPLLKTRQITLIDGGDFDAGLVHVRNLCDLLLAAASPLGDAHLGDEGRGDARNDEAHDDSIPLYPYNRVLRTQSAAVIAPDINDVPLRTRAGAE